MAASFFNWVIYLNLRLVNFLDEDQLLNELIHRNDRLIAYLAKEENLKEMIDFIVKDSQYVVISEA